MHQKFIGELLKSIQKRGEALGIYLPRTEAIRDQMDVNISETKDRILRGSPEYNAVTVVNVHGKKHKNVLILIRDLGKMVAFYQDRTGVAVLRETRTAHREGQ